MPQNSANLKIAISQYAASLAKFENPKYQPDIADVLAVMLARDAVQNELGNSQYSPDLCAKLLDLDRQLCHHAKRLNQNQTLAQCRQSLQPPESAWWWYIQESVEVDPRNRWNWFWQTLTVACVVGSTAFIVNTARAFSTEGFDLMQTFSTIAQGAGLAVIAQGTLTDKGQKQVEKVLNNLNVPSHLHAEVTFGASLTLLLASGAINSSLPRLGNYYYSQGMKYYKEGQMAIALRKYQEAFRFDPSTDNIYAAQGIIHESIEEYDKALENYKKGIIAGNPAAFHGLAKTIASQSQTNESELSKAKNYLLVGEDLVDNGDPAQILLRAQIHRDIGWIDLLRIQNLISNEKVTLESPQIKPLLASAQSNLEKAIDLETKIPINTPGWGMSQCYLAKILDYAEDVKAQSYADFCFEQAKPETIAQYSFLKHLDEYEITQKKIDVKGLVADESDFKNHIITIKNDKKLAELKAKITQTIQQKLQERSPVKLDRIVFYQVTVDEQGTIFEFEPTNPSARKFAIQTELNEIATHGESKRVAKFRVMLTPARDIQLSLIISDY
jgi:tetratricopeptide (TPR) repeat protein